MLNKYYYSDILFYSQGILMFYITTSPCGHPFLKKGNGAFRHNYQLLTANC